MTENERLEQARQAGKKIVGTMKDLGTIPVMAYALDNVVAFYPDGAWWIPCVMERQAGLLEIADSRGIDESFCPVRAMLGAFVNGEHFPIPDLLTCSVGATCDDFSAIAQRLPDLGFPVLWWEVPHRRLPDDHETAIKLPGGFVAPEVQQEFVVGELDRLRQALEDLSASSGRHPKGQQDSSVAGGVAAVSLYRRSLSHARSGNAYCRNAGHSLLLRSC
ncbi:hypothetical protein ACFL6U_27970 [Planctomycetota bacterium]